MLRSLLITVIAFGTLPAVFVRPDVGILLYSWFSYMYPQRLAYGFTKGIPFALIIGAVTFVAWLFSKERKSPPNYALTALMILMAVWITITQPFSINPAGAEIEWSQAIKVLAISVLTTILMQDRRRMTTLVWVIVASLGYFAVRGGISTIMHGGHTRLWGPDGSIIAENNALALALLTVIPLLRYMQLQAPRRWIRLGLYTGYPFFFLSVFGSYSRGAFVGLVAMLLYMSMKSRHRISLSIVILGAFAGAFYFMPQKYTQRLHTVETYQEDNSAEARLGAWYFALNFAKDHPIVGGGFKLPNDQAFWKYSLTPWSYVPRKAILVAHSIYFEMLQAKGIPGFLLLVSCIILAFRYGRTVARKTRGHPELYWVRDLSAMTQTALVGYCVGGAFLSLEFFDLLWHLISFMVICRAVVERELAKVPSAEAEAAPEPQSGRAFPAPALPRPATADGRQFRRVRGRGAL